MSSGKIRTYTESEISFNLAGLNIENVIEHYSRRYTKYLYHSSDELIYNDTTSIPKSDRFVFFLGHNKSNETGKVFCNQIRDGFPITEKDFIFDERVMLENFTTTKFKLRKQIELYTTYLDKREREIVKFGESPFIYPPIGNTPFAFNDQYELFKRLNDNFNHTDKIRWTHLYNYMKYKTKIKISEPKFFDFINEYFETVARRIQQNANSDKYYDHLDKVKASE
jgi:hypothetical protein